MRLVIFCFLLAIASLDSYAQSSLPPCPTTAPVEQWTNCSGTLTFPNGGIYIGEFQDGKRHGIGTRTNPDGTGYVGEYRNGTADGKGTLTTSAGTKYVGDFRAGVPHGQATEVPVNGEIYVGEYREGKRTEGRYTWPNGQSYTGEFRDGKLNGLGMLISADGSRLVGQRNDNRINGEGISYKSDGIADKSGLWVNGELSESYPIDANRFAALLDAERVAPSQLPRCESASSAEWTNCFGAIKYANGETYAGEFQNGKRHGFGTHTRGNGFARYVGEFRDDKPHGRGRYTERWTNDHWYIEHVGEFVDGQLVKGMRLDSNYTRFGEFRDNGEGRWELHGQGVLFNYGYTSRTRDHSNFAYKQSGEFNYGHFKKGVLTSEDQSKQVGEFRRSTDGFSTVLNGEGIAYKPNRKVNRSGLWADGKLERSYSLDAARFSFDDRMGDDLLFRVTLDVSTQRHELMTKQFQLAHAERSFFAATNEVQLATASERPSAASVVASPPPQPAPAQNLRRVALVIGNARYSNAPVLTNPPADAASVSAALRDAGFQTVTVKTDLSQQATLTALREFSKLADAADWAVVYYAGHGIEFGGNNYLIPVDARLQADRDIDLEGVDLGKVMAAVEGAKRLRLIILDACRDNPFANQMRRTMASRSLGRGLAKVEPEPGTLIAYAAKHGETAMDGSGTSNSPFAESLVRRIKQTPPVEIRRLFDYVRDDVLKATNKKQQPFSYGSVSAEEDFFFTAPR